MAGPSAVEVQVSQLEEAGPSLNIIGVKVKEGDGVGERERERTCCWDRKSGADDTPLADDMSTLKLHTIYLEGATAPLARGRRFERCRQTSFALPRAIEV